MKSNKTNDSIFTRPSTEKHTPLIKKYALTLTRKWSRKSNKPRYAMALCIYCLGWKNLPSQKLNPLGIMGALIEVPPSNHFNTIVLWCSTGFSGGPSSVPPCCRESLSDSCTYDCSTLQHYRLSYDTKCGATLKHRPFGPTDGGVVSPILRGLLRPIFSLFS